MESERVSEMILEVFGRFMVSGVVFYLFLIWIPVFLFFHPRYDILVSNTTVIILGSLVIGLLLDISKFYRFSWKISSTQDMNKENLEICIVRAFQIKVDDYKMNDKNYKGKVKELANQIHEVFVRTQCQEEYQIIRAARLYPDVLSMTLFSIFLFIIEWIAILGLAIAGVIGVSLNVNKAILLLVVVPCAYIFYTGLDRVRPIYAQTRDYTTQMIKEGYNQSGQKEKNDFLGELEERGLIVYDAGNRWKVNG